MPVTPDHLRKLADAIEAEEKEAEQELQRAEKAQASEERIARLEAELVSLREEKAAIREEKRELKEQREAAASEETDEVAERRARTRPGRKRGNLYADSQTGEGYVYDGDDEPDEVPLEDEPEAEEAS